MSPAPRFVGSEVKRLEDPRLIQGHAQYVDDLDFHGLAHAWLLRSPHARARLVRVDAADAAKLPGVYAVLTAADLAGRVAQSRSWPRPLACATRCGFRWPWRR